MIAAAWMLIIAMLCSTCPSFYVSAAGGTVGLKGATTLADSTAALADDALILNEKSIMLNPGHTFEIKIADESFKGLDEWLIEYNSPTYSTSNPEICVVDKAGTISAVGVGTAVITVQCAGMTGQIKCSVKSNGTLISRRTAQLNTGESFYLSFSVSQTVKSRSCRVTDAHTGEVASDAFTIKKQNTEGYSITAKRAGSYYIDLYAYEYDGTVHSGRCYVTVLKNGLVSDEIAVAIDSTVEVGLSNAQVESAEYVRDADIGGEEKGSTKYAIYEDSQGDRICKITGVKAGTSVMRITSKTADGEKMTETLYIRVTEPAMTELPQYMVVGEEYEPSVTGIRKCSSISLYSQDESIMQAVNTDNQRCSFVPVGIGSVKIALIVDGRQFIRTVKCIKPALSEDAVLLKKGKKTVLSVDGIPPSMDVRYSTSNKKIAKITGSGKITAKKNGTAVITATVGDNITLTCKVTVGSKKSLKAVHAAEAVLGAGYSQAKRMSEGYYDCSSLVWRAYREAGASLTEDNTAPVAADLAKYLEKNSEVIAYKYVSADELEPGDLIFYAGSEDNGRYRSICHVSMYYGDSVEQISGRNVNVGTVIHACNGVELSNYSSFRVNRIVLIVRPID